MTDAEDDRSSMIGITYNPNRSRTCGWYYCLPICTLKIRALQSCAHYRHLRYYRPIVTSSTDRKTLSQKPFCLGNPALAPIPSLLRNGQLSNMGPLRRGPTGDRSFILGRTWTLSVPRVSPSSASDYTATALGKWLVKGAVGATHLVPVRDVD